MARHSHSRRDVLIGSGIVLAGLALPSNLALAQWRGYSASKGRWLSHDPLAEFDGPNRYRYARNSPVIFYDRDGLLPSSSSGGGVPGLAGGVVSSPVGAAVAAAAALGAAILSFPGAKLVRRPVPPPPPQRPPDGKCTLQREFTDVSTCPQMTWCMYLCASGYLRLLIMPDPPGSVGFTGGCLKTIDQ